MGLREALNQNKALSAGTVVALLLVALVVLAFTFSGGNAAPSPEENVPERIWFYDVGTDEIFSGPEGAGPVEPPSEATLSNGEPGGVIAAVFACNDCADPDDRYVGYVELVPEELRTMPMNVRSDHTNSIAEVPADGGSLEWMAKASPRGQEIVQAARQRCPNGQPQQCFPSAEE